MGRNPWNDLGSVKLAKCAQSASAAANLVAGADAVVNLAYDFSAPGTELLNEFEALLQSCEAAASLKAFVQFSSIAVYDGWPGGNITEDSPADGPGGIYKQTKRAMEKRLARSPLPHTILQPTIVYGPRSPQWTEKILDQFRIGAVVLPAGQDGFCHAVHIDDLVAAAILALRQKVHSGARYIISGAHPVAWRDFYNAHAQLLGKPAASLEAMPEIPEASGSTRRPAAPNALRQAIRVFRSVFPHGTIAAGRRWLRAFASVGKPIVYRPPPSDLAMLRARGSCSIVRAREDLGYEPKVDFETGMRMVADSLKQRGRWGAAARSRDTP